MRKPTYKELEYLFALEKQTHDLTKKKLEAAMMAAQSLDEPIPYTLTPLAALDSIREVLSEGDVE